MGHKHSRGLVPSPSSSGLLLVVGVGLAGLSSIPGVAATGRIVNHGPWCTKINEHGQEVYCRSGLTKGATIGIGLGVSAGILLIAFIIGYIYYSRKDRKSSSSDLEQQRERERAAITSIEAAQMAGPPTVLAATYNPASGTPQYTLGSAGSSEHWTPVMVQTPPVGRNRVDQMMQMPSGPVAPFTPGGSRRPGNGVGVYPFGGHGSATVRS